MKLLEENPGEAIKVMVENTIKSNFHFVEGVWHIASESSDGSGRKEWRESDKEPIEEMNIMREELTAKLKVQFEVKEGGSDPLTATTEKGMTAEQIRKIQRNKKKSKRAAEKKKQKWYQSKINTYIYFSGLPSHIDVQAVDDFFSRAGLIRKDHVTAEKKIKLYKVTPTENMLFHDNKLFPSSL